MDIVAHGLWTAAAATAGKRKLPKISVPWAAWWGMFPDVLAFGPAVAAGLARWIAGGGAHRPHLHLGVPLYPLGHSLVIFAAAFGLVSLAARRPVLSMLGWALHILIDIPTHSYSYYATRFLWPFTNYGVDGIAWWTRWLWISTYAGLAVVYFAMWKKGCFKRKRRNAAEVAERALRGGAGRSLSGRNEG